MTDLGTLGGFQSIAWRINERGQIMGESFTSNSEVHAFLWQKGVMTDLGTLGGSNSTTTSINNRGQVVGYSQTTNDARHAFLWKK